MRCPRCGNSVSDSESYCSWCGQWLTEDADAVTKSNKPLLIAMIAIVLAMLVVTFLAFTGKLGPHDPEPEPVAAATMTPEAACRSGFALCAAAGLAGAWGASWALGASLGGSGAKISAMLPT